MTQRAFADKGWVRFPARDDLDGWLVAAMPEIGAAIADVGNRAKWLRCAGTWFAGVNVLGNDPTGAVGGAGALCGPAVDFAAALTGVDPIAWDAGQVSVVWPGYPQPREGESEAAARYRRDRDAAHVDGLHPVGPKRARKLREHHAFVLGIGASDTGPEAGPVSVWEGSHRILKRHLSGALAGVRAADWADIDLTAAYHAARREAFGSCPRITIPVARGESYVIHRHALHGIARYPEDAGSEARKVIYFRPEAGIGAERWLNAD